MSSNAPTSWSLALTALLAAPALGDDLVLGTPGEKSIRLSGRVQVRYTGYDQSEADENSFRIRRIRVKLDGWVHPDVRYEVQVGTASRSLLETDRIQLLDADAGIELHDYALVKAGQFKAPFGREFLVTSAQLDSIDRALIESLVPNRQLGAMITSTWDVTDLGRGRKDHRIDYGVGVFNGNGINRDRNDNTDSLIAARVVGRPHDKFSIGGNVFTSKDSASVSSSAVGLSAAGRRTGYGVDARFESGRVKVQGEYIRVDFDPEPARIPDRTLSGFYVQPGVFLVPDVLEGFVRYQEFDPDEDATDDSDKRWTHLGINYFIKKDHTFKLQVEYVLKKEDGIEIDDDVAMAQLQVAW